jgi:hypothetical protein
MFNQSSLFSAVSTSFIVAMQINLIPNPIDTTNALLVQLVHIGVGNITAVSAPATPASTWSASKTPLRIQAIAYASLSLSLLVAFGAALCKQWLGHYKSNRYGCGSEEVRGKSRQEKFDGLSTWHFDAVVQSFPVLLQISLLLFGTALSANLWYEQPSIAWVVIATTAFGFLFYSLTVMACLISPSCRGGVSVLQDAFCSNREFSMFSQAHSHAPSALLLDHLIFSANSWPITSHVSSSFKHAPSKCAI